METVIEFKLDGVKDTGQPPTTLELKADPKIVAEDTKSFQPFFPCNEEMIEIQVRIC